MLKPIQTGTFRKDAKRMGKRDKNLSRPKGIMEDIIYQRPLPPRLRDHALSGNWAGHRECHIEPDWLLIYRLTETEVIFTRTGIHADLFS